LRRSDSIRIVTAAPGAARVSLWQPAKGENLIERTRLTGFLEPVAEADLPGKTSEEHLQISLIQVTRMAFKAHDAIGVDKQSVAG